MQTVKNIIKAINKKTGVSSSLEDEAKVYKEAAILISRTTILEGAKMKKSELRELIREELKIRFWNMLIDVVNRAWGDGKPMMLRQRKDGRHHIQMVNTFHELPKEFVKAAKSIKDSEIDESKRLIILPEDGWKKIYAIAKKSK